MAVLYHPPMGLLIVVLEFGLFKITPILLGKLPKNGESWRVKAPELPIFRHYPPLPPPVFGNGRRGAETASLVGRIF